MSIVFKMQNFCFLSVIIPKNRIPVLWVAVTYEFYASDRFSVPYTSRTNPNRIIITEGMRFEFLTLDVYKFIYNTLYICVCINIYYLLHGAGSFLRS